MFGMGFTEILLIAIVAILFLGPDKLPAAMVKIAKFMKSVKKAIGDAKGALDEELKIADLKEEAMSYKKQLDDVSDELKGFKNIGINPMDDINDAISEAKSSFDGGGFADAAQKAESQTIATQVEPKKDKVTFEKKPKASTQSKENNSKGGEA